MPYIEQYQTFIDLVGYRKFHFILKAISQSSVRIWANCEFESAAFDLKIRYVIYESNQDTANE